MWDGFMATLCHLGNNVSHQYLNDASLSDFAPAPLLLPLMRALNQAPCAIAQDEEGAGDSTLAGSGFGGSGKLSDVIVAECRSEFAAHVATLRAFIEEHNLRSLSPQGAVSARMQFAWRPLPCFLLAPMECCGTAFVCAASMLGESN